ncbi:BMC domain-containing protein [Romboutsia sp. Marseille-P6047]|uniref:BMC domain-containing protein n=1 Tax=Romboutsia sp. Marseille-P6047 TaxID=2161817 RepID=UPI000F04B6DE|nr:BMC domain-containing protein [Romboutsia sp. Marseille-P6047]
MSQLAIGMIETVGLAAGIEAADVCVKSANVSLIGYELTKGNGMTVVKIEGNVGAVKAAIEAATVAANKVSKVFSTKVIPRPSEGIDFLMRNSDTIGYLKENTLSDKSKEECNNIIENNDLNEETSEKINEIQEETDISEYEDTSQEDIKDIIDTNEEINNLEMQTDDSENIEEELSSNNGEEYTCNLCKDPKCPRQKGDLKTNCIHYEDHNK